LVCAVKGSRYVALRLALRDPRGAVANCFASGGLALGPALGPILGQLPGRHRFDADVLSAFLAALPRSTGEALELARGHDERLDGRAWLEHDDDRPLRYALEPRSDSFHDPAVRDLLEQHGVALAVADTAGRWPRFEPTETDLVYVRLHGAAELYTSGYSPAELATWAQRCLDWSRTAVGEPRDVYVYFDNDAHGHAPHDALALAGLLADGGSNLVGEHP